MTTNPGKPKCQVVLHPYTDLRVCGKSAKKREAYIRSIEAPLEGFKPAVELVVLYICEKHYDNA